MSEKSLLLVAEIERLKKENEDLRKALLTDELTGLGNFRSLTEDLNTLLDTQKMLSNNTSEKVALLFVDVDAFKGINETHGHWAASKLLGSVGRRISRVIRESDFAYRYGGDEFVILIRGAEKNIHEMSQRIQKAIGTKSFDVDGFKGRTQVNLTISVGVRVLTPEDSAVALIEEADKALFEAKRRIKTNLSLVA